MGPYEPSSDEAAHMRDSGAEALIRSSGGNVKRKLYMPLFRIYGEKLREARSAGVPPADCSKKSIPENNESEEDYDPKHPASLEVEKLRKKWDDMMDKYKLEIEAVAKLYRDPHAVKPGISKTMPKRDDFESEFTLQFLPVWLFKKIVGYLDDKSMQSLKKVGLYCTYAVQDVLRERYAREQLDEYIASKKAEIGTEKIQNILKTFEELKPKPVLKKHSVFYDMGAIDEKLVPTVKSKLVEESFVCKAIKEMQGEVSQLNGEIVPFPRLISDDFDLYGYRPCFLKDIDVRYNADSNIEQQKSILTYSLASIMSTLKISVDEETLSEW